MSYWCLQRNELPEEQGRSRLRSLCRGFRAWTVRVHRMPWRERHARLEDSGDSAGLSRSVCNLAVFELEPRAELYEFELY